MTLVIFSTKGTYHVRTFITHGDFMSWMHTHARNTIIEGVYPPGNTGVRG